jgi:hypothetical protein
MTSAARWTAAVLTMGMAVSAHAQVPGVREIGRVVQGFKDLGRYDNTLIIYINGDNGTSAEGGPLGTPNEVAFFNGLNQLPTAVQMKFYDVWGTEQTYNHMSAGWIQAPGPGKSFLTAILSRARASGGGEESCQT